MLKRKRGIVLAFLVAHAVATCTTVWLARPELALAKTSTRSQATEHVCQHTLCRSPQTIRLIRDDGGVFESTLDVENPIVNKGWISIFPGETLFVEADSDENRLVNLRAVTQVEDPARTLEFKFWQDEGKPDMFLKVKNPFPKTVKYHAVMMLLDSDKLYKTSSCPVSARKMAFEHWQHAIFELLLFDFRLIGDDVNSSRCEF